MPLTIDRPVLPVVDGLALPPVQRELLKPGALVSARDGVPHRLPRYFFEVESWALALATPLTPHFGLWEFMDVDLREPQMLRLFPRYIPCAVTMLAAALELLRVDAGVPVRIAANGGYRSPSHQSSIAADAGGETVSAHCWATAANIYRVGADALDDPERIERYAAAIRRLLPFAWVRPYGEERGAASDHLHVEIGYLTLAPRGASEHEPHAPGR
jgi:hypothetical protein